MVFSRSDFVTQESSVSDSSDSESYEAEKVMGKS